jgi:hypothetical protein
VTEPARPIGLPTATTSWPIFRSSALPSGAAGAPAFCTRTTARSESASAPTTSKEVSVPSANAAVPLVAPATTWALVRRKPSPVKVTAEPAPAPRLVRTASAATEGSRLAATPVTMRL